MAILIDPDKIKDDLRFKDLLKRINVLRPDYVFVGGSTVDKEDFTNCCQKLKSYLEIPLVIFPGAHNQVSSDVDGILFLSLLSGRNPDYLIGHQVQAAPVLKKTKLEIMPTAYLLIDGGKPSSVSYVSQTTPIPNDQITIAVNTAMAGEMMGNKLVFMDAGSGALDKVPSKMISEVKKNINVPLIIGGGVKTIKELDECYNSGANLVVIGNKIEQNEDFLLDLANYFSQKKESISAENT
ncbi:MAG: geranylgeranylglyceryl/heptaprenylglyceryl phosphate synthase [Crocinitomicaceae bacterium]|nr:geranylgeranylglyceryl/heptaprenylglyceryl phosphate synthase [Crocinitomicaceae bacterium]